MTALKITQIGNSLGLIFPKEILARPKLEKGDSVFVTATTPSSMATSAPRSWWLVCVWRSTAQQLNSSTHTA